VPSVRRASAHPRPACRRVAGQRHRATPIRCARPTRSRKARVSSRTIRPAAHRGRGSSSSVKLSFAYLGIGVGGVAELRASQAGAHPLHGSYPRRRPSPKATPVFLRDARAWKRGRSNAITLRHSPYHLVMVRSGAGFRFSPRELPMQWTTTVPVWPTCTTPDVPRRLQEAINQLIAEYGPPTRGRLRYLDRQIR
jgi:hypothetical protein